MKLRDRTPLVLALVAVALAGYIGLCERRTASTDRARAERLQVFPGLSRAGLGEIEIDRGAQGKSTLARVTDAHGGVQWRVMPDDQPAAAGAVADLLDAIDALEIDRESAADARAAGLQPPAAVLTMTATGGPAPARYVLQVGALDANGRGAFVRRAGEARTLVVGRRLRDLVDRDPVAFRERRLFAPGVVEAAQTIGHGDGPGSWRTLRKRGGLWLTTAGFLAGRAPMAEVVRELAGLEASGFPVGRVPPEIPQRWTLALGEGEEAPTLRVWQWPCVRRGDRSQWLATVHGGQTSSIICLAGDTIDRLWRQLAAADRAEPHLLPVDPAEVDGAVLSERDRAVHLRRDPTAGWRITEPAVAYAADAAQIDEWLAGLSRVALSDQGTSTQPSTQPSTPPSAPPGARRLVLEGARRAEIIVAPPRAGKVLVERSGELGAASAPATLFAELDPDPLRFRSRLVLELARFDVDTIAIRTPAGERRLKHDAGDRWADLPSAEVAAVERLLTPLSRLAAERFLPDARPLVARDSLEIATQRGADAMRIHLEIDAHCRARLTGTPVFALAPDTCEALRAAMLELTRTK